MSRMTLDDAIKTLGNGSLESKILRLYPYMYAERFGVFPLSDPHGVVVQTEGKFLTFQFIKASGSMGESFVHWASDRASFKDIAYKYLIASFPDEPKDSKEPHNE